MKCRNTQRILKYVLISIVSNSQQIDVYFFSFFPFSNNSSMKNTAAAPVESLLSANQEAIFHNVCYHSTCSLHMLLLLGGWCWFPAQVSNQGLPLGDSGRRWGSVCVGWEPDWLAGWWVDNIEASASTPHSEDEETVSKIVERSAGTQLESRAHSESFNSTKPAFQWQASPWQHLGISPWLISQTLLQQTLMSVFL